MGRLIVFVLTLMFAGAAAATPVRIVALGTSLTAGYGLPAGQSYVDQLAALLKAKGYVVALENAGVSGDTSAGGLSRLDWTIASNPQIVVLELGSNDALRGIPPKETERNLDRILTRLNDKKIPVLFVGMLAPPNLGKEYGEEFNAIYPRLAKAHQVIFYPFVLEGVAANPKLNQADGIHPNAAGAKLMAEHLLPLIEPLVKTAMQPPLAQPAAP